MYSIINIETNINKVHEIIMSEIAPLLALVLFVSFIYLLANWSQRNREHAEPHIIPAAMSYLILIGIYGLLLIVGLGLFGAASALTTDGNPEIVESMRAVLNEEIDFDSVLDRLPLLGLGLWVPSLVGILLLLPFVRRFAARFINIDALSPVHAITLSLSMFIVIQLMVTLGIGLENIAGAASIASEASGDENGLAMIGALWVQQLGTAFIGLVGIGWLLRRDWAASLERLGIQPLTSNQLTTGIGIGLVMVPIVMLIEFVSRQLLGIGVDPGVEALSEELLGPLMQSPLGILTIGLSAAIGEETLFRGAAQPRLGILLTSLLFALVHSNYGLSISTVIVFVLGLVLGYIRLRHNTSTAMVIHAVYNSTLGLLAYLSIPYLE